MRQKPNRNAGYRLGLFVRRVCAWNTRLADNAQKRGIPRWVARIPALLVLGAIAGLLLAGAVFMAGFIVLVLFIGICLAGASEAKCSISNESLEEGYTVGPEGPGIYVGGKKISNDDR
ncbi:DUF3742 family protein [Citrobacter portucalensis]|uniref:DUF3742 family protein n=1 Tax=Citrobacter portucalensis TaxID=1639133 RepID=UPI00226BB09B|nr:DUF3742 family protein [Citrobacter portucalensis]MCX8984238.1 DUF3742 family protein [Citrobacter portucalensis]